ncbi:hypothetical protein VTN77DRAFT_9123 [Rasamsonia byssochlamydoides]|uniref:uncharacterized protein n=1 Tax=Rasamsonia byssochlamydoides TaxID=89139 RepID=UPI00374360F7
MRALASLSTFNPRCTFVTAVTVVFLVVAFSLFHESPTAVISGPVFIHRPRHPIDDLVREAAEEWRALLSKETRDVAAAARAYRARRGRHPPPGFAEWFDYATSRGAVMVEDFFDQIYHDLTPYWGIEPQELRQQAASFATRIVVRNRLATVVTDADRVWMTAWHSLVQSIQEHLPDLDIPINTMDESRIVVPWATLSQYVQRERATRRMPPVNEVVTEFMNLSASEAPAPTFDPEFKNADSGSFWDLVRVGCPDDSPSRHSHMQLIDDFSNPPLEFYNYVNLSFHGYVKNWTRSKDPCLRPELQVLHGSFIEPVSISTSHKLFPLFGGSKLPMNNEILIPPAMYWADDEMYSGGENEHGGAWWMKRNRFIWRGAATGGRNREENWTGFQRHRFLSMLNATAVRLVETKKVRPLNFALPTSSDYPLLRAVPEGHLADFIEPYSDVGFVHLVCFPYDPANPHCPYTEPYFSVIEGLPMKKQYAYKYLPDLDGNSFSGRYRGFLLSTSLPIKATIYNEWHDSRLVPWAHFVPMDSTFMDIYGIMEYFLGYKGRGGHDSVARKIALDGKRWAERLLRKEDMQIYTYRLLLEYARISDDRREMLGYVDDL